MPSSGSTIQTRSRSSASAVVLALLAEHDVSGPDVGQQPHQQLVGGWSPASLSARPPDPAADLQEQVAGLGGGPGRDGVVVGIGREQVVAAVASSVARPSLRSSWPRGALERRAR